MFDPQNTHFARRLVSFLFAIIAALWCTDAHAGPMDWLKEKVTGVMPCSKLTADFSVSETNADGDDWDYIHSDAKPDPSGTLIVRRDGKIIKDNNGKSASERLGVRMNQTDFSAPFFQKSGITLQKGDVVKISLYDFDEYTKPDFIGTIELTVDGRTVSGSAQNGLFKVTITCEQ